MRRRRLRRVVRVLRRRQDLQQRPVRDDLRPDERLPADTRLWAALQQASGGTWAGCVYDVERIVQVIEAGVEALALRESD